MQALTQRLIDKLPQRYQRVAKQFIKFGVTGVVGAIIDFGTYAILTRGVGWTSLYVIAGYEISAANNVSVLVAIMSNFLLNKYWTFRYREGSAAKQWLGYFGLNVVTWALNQLLMSYFAFRVPLFNQLFGDNKDFAAKVAAICFILFVNFAGSKFLVFKSRPTVVA
ncbi:MAG: GtrA family protein [Candidatus Andersenbacteria bacterium]|nr:GtrA family protein [Candidatus Andersenbacteria bacterium]